MLNRANNLEYNYFTLGYGLNCYVCTNTIDGADCSLKDTPAKYLKGCSEEEVYCTRSITTVQTADYGKKCIKLFLNTSHISA